MNTALVPVVKWAGGKRWLVASSPELFPTNYNRLIEPFLGGASVFLNQHPDAALLADINSELINTYTVIRDDWRLLYDKLVQHHNMHSHEYYYKMRNQRPRTDLTRAARFLYLNRTCWNGLYRVNRRGEFNVPIGTKDNVLLSTDDFEGFSKRLNNNVELRSQGFRETMSNVRKGDFVYIDPPYTVKHDNNGFVKYNESIFSWDDQIDLRDLVVEAARKGVKILISQANHASIHDLYFGVGDIQEISRKSVIAASSRHRSSVQEVIVKINY